MSLIVFAIDTRAGHAKKRLRGLSLIELMVALAIGVVMALAISQVLSSFEGRKRSTTSVNDINQAGNYALYIIDKAVRSAGSGFGQARVFSVSTSKIDVPAFGCPLYAAKNGTPVLPRTSLLPNPFQNVDMSSGNLARLIPLLIVPDATTPGVSGSGSDALLVMSGSSGLAEMPVPYGYPPLTAAVTPVNTVGFKANDLVLLIDQQPSNSAGVFSPCIIEQLSNSFSGGVGVSDLSFSGTYYAASIGGKSLSGMSSDGFVAGLGNVVAGNAPSFSVLGVGDNNTLFSYDLLETSGTLPLPLADTVFELHALYGVDNNDDGRLDSWLSPSDTTSGYTLAALTAGDDAAARKLKQIKAIKIGLILRTSLPEKDAVAPASLSLFNDAVTFTRNLSAAEQKFRYRTIETTIPLRNSMLVN